ncbi:YidX family protein [Psychrobacter lutiphocae]|uniref:hypothetical protein n=1 Tax=Psychrobacter lutiphocae TaxID=540500 RepID=UPI00037F6946|nr:hypothetical protein [Psychrobacter lutiphocae]
MRPLSKSTKTITILTLSFMLLTINGCLSVATVSKANKTRFQETYTTVDSDIIRQMGKVTTDEKKEKLVFFGDKYTYLIEQGADKVQLTAKLDSQYLQFENPIYVNRGNNNELRTFLKFNYDKPDANYQKHEVTILDQFCHLMNSTVEAEKIQSHPHSELSHINDYKIKSEYYRCQIYLDGKLYQASQQFIAKTPFRQGQPIVIQQVATRQYKHQANLLALPITAVIDVVTLPFQLIGVGATLAVMHE